MRQRHAAAPLRPLQPVPDGHRLPDQRAVLRSRQRAHAAHLPTPFGYTNTSRELEHAHARREQVRTARTVNVEIIFRWRPLSETADTRPLWLDIDSICSGGDSEYTIPTGYSDTHVELDRAAGRPHDRHGRPPARHRHHRPERRARPTARSAATAIALSAELVGGRERLTSGRSRRTTRRPRDITGATMCSSEANYGTPSAPRTAARSPRHDEPVRDLQRLARGQTARGLPAGGELPDRRLPITAGQVIRLHSEYQNDSGGPRRT